MLASFLTPAICSARRNATAAKCLSNERQIGLGIMSYASDWDGLCPQIYWVADQSGATWRTMVRPYVGNHSVFLCPDNPIGINPSQLVAQPRLEPGFPVSYEMALGWHGGIVPVVLSDLPDPADAILLGETNGTPGLDAWDMTETLLLVDGTTIPALHSHAGGSNFVFADGHARKLRFMQTL